jgi:hypothetical protein
MKNQPRGRRQPGDIAKCADGRLKISGDDYFSVGGNGYLVNYKPSRNLRVKAGIERAVGVEPRYSVMNVPLTKFSRQPAS